MSAPVIKTALHPSGETLEFNSGLHEYSFKGEILTSATTLIHKQFPVFDAQAIAVKKAKKEGINASDLLQDWEANRIQASQLGNAVHSMAEKIILSKDLTAANDMPNDERERNYLHALKKAILTIGKNFEFVATEKIVFSPQNKVAGTIDLLLRNRKTGRIVVADWKTNKEIKRQSFRSEMGLGICSHLQNCNYVHYSLQLALYREMLLQEGYYPKTTEVTSAIIHLRQVGEIVQLEQIDPRPLITEAKKLLLFKT